MKLSLLPLCGLDTFADHGLFLFESQMLLKEHPNPPRDLPTETLDSFLFSFLHGTQLLFPHLWVFLWNPAFETLSMDQLALSYLN